MRPDQLVPSSNVLPLLLPQSQLSYARFSNEWSLWHYDVPGLKGAEPLRTATRFCNALRPAAYKYVTVLVRERSIFNLYIQSSSSFLALSVIPDTSIPSSVLTMSTDLVSARSISAAPILPMPNLALVLVLILVPVLMLVVVLVIRPLRLLSPRRLLHDLNDLPADSP